VGTPATRNGAMAQPSDSGPETTAALLAGYLHAAGVRHVSLHPGRLGCHGALNSRG